MKTHRVTKSNRALHFIKYVTLYVRRNEQKRKTFLSLFYLEIVNKTIKFYKDDKQNREKPPNRPLSAL